MNRVKAFKSAFLTVFLVALVVPIFSGCASAIIKEESPESAILGTWKLEKRETLAQIYSDRQMDFSSLSKTEQWQVEQSFQFGFMIRFNSDATWMGRYENRGKVSGGRGTYRILSFDGNRMMLETLETEKLSNSAEVIDIQFQSEHKILLAMSEAGGGTRQLILTRSEEDDEIPEDF